MKNSLWGILLCRAWLVWFLHVHCPFICHHLPSFLCSLYPFLPPQTSSHCVCFFSNNDNWYEEDPDPVTCGGVVSTTTGASSSASTTNTATVTGTTGLGSCYGLFVLYFHFQFYSLILYFTTTSCSGSFVNDFETNDYTLDNLVNGINNGYTIYLSPNVALGGGSLTLTLNNINCPAGIVCWALRSSR